MLRAGALPCRSASRRCATSARASARTRSTRASGRRRSPSRSSSSSCSCYYRFSGVLAVGGLALYVLYTLAILAGFDAVLTLPGLAGFVLSIGIAVDANVLIFERIREELDRGKTVRTAIDEGFRHAMPAIIDSNVSTILTAAVLYQYGTGPVKGFAVTLIAGIVASLVTSIFVVRTFYLIWLQPLARRPDAEHLRAAHAAHSSRHEVRLHQALEEGRDRSRSRGSSSASASSAHRTA